MLEALVALAVVAISLSSIGMVVSTTVRGTRSIERRLTEIETARGIMAALPDRDQLALGTLSGEVAEHPWRIDVLPYVSNTVDQRQTTKWIPQLVIVSVKSPDGAMMRIDTIRLHQRAGG